MLSIAQATAILSILMAFGVDAGTVAKVHDILIPVSTTTQAFVPVIQSPIIENQPIYFGSTIPVNNQPIINTPMVQAESPKWIIDVSTSKGTTVQAGTGKYGFNVRVYDANDTDKKNPLNVPVTVTTNDPDLPSSFTINAPHQVGYFCVAPTYDGFPNNGCKNENPVSVGTFDFTFTVEDVNKTVQVTVTE